MSVRKVLWRNGTLVTEEHLRALEGWAEALAAAYFSTEHGPGLLRGPGEKDLNGPASVRLVGAELRSDVRTVELAFQGLRAVTPFGRLVEITGPVKKTVKKVPREDRTLAVLVAPAGKPTEPRGVADEPVLCEPGFEVRLGGAADDAVAVAVLVVSDQGKKAALKADFLPPCVTVGGCQALAGRADELRQAARRCLEVADAHRQALLKQARAAANASPGWQVAQAVVGAWRAAWPALDDRNASPQRFLRLAGWFAEECGRELALFQCAASAAAEKKLDKALAALAEASDGSDESGDLGPPFRAGRAALEAAAAALGACFGGYQPPLDLRVRAAGVRDFDEKWERAEVTLEDSLRAELLRAGGAARVLVGLRCGARRLDADERDVRIDPTAEPLECDTTAKLKKGDEPGAFTFKYAPPDEHLDKNKIVFYLDRNVQLKRNTDGDCADFISVQGTGDGTARHGT